MTEESFCKILIFAQDDKGGWLRMTLGEVFRVTVLRPIGFTAPREQKIRSFFAKLTLHPKSATICPKGGGLVKAKTLTRMALLSAIALTIFMLEAQIPPPIPVPGIKLGLSNIVTVFAVFLLGPWQAAGILFVRIFLGAVFAGNFSTILYSAAGGLLALLVSVGLRRILKSTQIWVAGVLGAIAHSVGQMAVAVAVTGTPGLLAYLPVLMICSIAAGLFTGLCAQVLINRGEKLWKTILK